jgi:acyl transferase domain-containing protein/NAD(P)H-dependent flavin oxidoreductase YrpB (nitropropane dioxygenase family)/NAD(P)-dependent dehydrogenase (short-subunit alcohol dehydrogenase family)/phosphopantetheinyl transferase/acyl carrier protein
MRFGFSLPDLWLSDRTDQSVLIYLRDRVRVWVELTTSWQERWREAVGVFTTDEGIARTIPMEGVLAAGPKGSGLEGLVVRRFEDLEGIERGRTRFLLVIPEECAGRCGEEGGMVLIPACVHTGLRVIVRGGYGPCALAGLELLGVEEVLLEELLWSCLDFLPDPWRKVWEEGSAFETRAFPTPGGERIRFFARPGFPVTRSATREKEDLDLVTLKAPDFRERCLPAGGGTGLPRRWNLPGDLERRLRVLGEEVRRLREKVEESWPFLPGEGFAREEGCRLPISQGPMANVAESVPFARAVAEAGAFPWLALASMPEEPASQLLSTASRELAGIPFGVGIIGLSTNRFLELHLSLIQEFGIQRVLVAAGTPELGLRLEEKGVRTYLHTPSPDGLREALEVGLLRFVWEGREAGGHVGVLPSLALYEQNLAVIKTFEEGSRGGTLTVLFAGGLGTRESFLLTAPFATALRDLNHRSGVQMGTAYLLTREAVEFSAIAEIYPRVLERVQTTVVLGESVGAPTRVLKTPRAEEVRKEEEGWKGTEVPFGERKRRFEEFNFGALRLAARGERVILKEGKSFLLPASFEEAEKEGLFHIGSVAYHPLPPSISKLHEVVTTPVQKKAPEIIQGIAREVDERAVAIVGVSFALPGGIEDLPALYRFLGEKGSAIGEVPRRVWNPDLFYDPEGQDPFRSYTKIGAFLKEEEPPLSRIKLPPRTLSALDPTQILAIRLAEKLLYAGIYPYEDPGERERTDVILGVAVGGDLKDRTAFRILLSALKACGPFDLKDSLPVEEWLGFSLPEPTEDSMPGELANVTAGRISSLFDLGGANFTVDSACASSLHAISLAVDRIRSGQARWVITGGVDRNMGISAYVKFSRLNALARRGSYPFDERAEGFVMGEGGALFLLTGYPRAVRENLPIYGVILGCGLASDGKGKGITAPNPSGQRRAIIRAWEDARIIPAELVAIEAHGTATPLGDLVETRVLKELLSEVKHPVGIGSIKGNIGHLKAAAGGAGVVKAILMTGLRVLLPSGGLERPREELGLHGDPLYPISEVSSFPSHLPPRMGISAFGFGGTDAHLVLEGGDALVELKVQLDEGKGDPPSLTRISTDDLPGGFAMSYQSSVAERTGFSPEELEGIVRDVVSEITGYDPGELGRDLDLEGDLGIDTVKIAEIAAQLRRRFDLPKDPRLKLSEINTIARMAEYLTRRLGEKEGEGVATTQIPPERKGGEPSSSLLASFRWGIFDGYRFASIREEVEEGKIEEVLKGKPSPRKALRKRILLHKDLPSRLVFLFPGQGSQRVGILRELRGIRVVSETIETAERVFKGSLDIPLSRFLFAEKEDPEGERLDALLRETRYTQPVLLTVEVALLRLLEELGVVPGVVCGHSLGEFSACVAAGVLSFETALHLVSGRARSMEEAARSVNDPGRMIALALSGEETARFLEKHSLRRIEIANYNSPRQTVVGGPSDEVEHLILILEREGIPFRELRVSHAFHTSLVSPAEKPMAELLKGIEVRSPRIPIYSNVTAEPYPDDPEEIRRLLAIQLKSPVLFTKIIRNILDTLEDSPAFLEVGPGRVLTHLVEEQTPEEILALPTLVEKESPSLTLSRAYALSWVATGSPSLPQEGRMIFAGEGEKSTVSLVEITSPPILPTPVDPEEIVISGLAMAVPGAGGLLTEEGMKGLLRGVNGITPIPDEAKRVLVELGVEQVIKGEDGSVTTRMIERVEDAPSFAGQLKGLPDLTLIGVHRKVLPLLDRTSLIAVAGAYQVLRDAGIPLIPNPEGERGESAWILPPPLGESTGVVYATVFGGLDVWIKVLTGRRPFPRTFLVESLSLAHSHIARLLKITGPTLKCDTACASTLSALAIAEDWIRTSRAERVIVVSADLAGDLPLYPYIAGGFLAVGALSTDRDLELSATPFGKDRHGTIIGSGMVAFLLERAKGAEERGVYPRARLKGVRIFNDAVHPMRMNPDRIAQGLKEHLEDLNKRGILPREVPPRAFLFFSHEPFTPRRGGSAETEAKALRHVFGPGVREIPVVNVKGYTGHPMGASLEDGIAILALEEGEIPPIRNLKDRDPEFSDLNLSSGGSHQAVYALHLSAGFGAQSGWVLYERMPERRKERKDPERIRHWLSTLTGKRWAWETPGVYARPDEKGQESSLKVSDRPQERALTSLELVPGVVIEGWGWEETDLPFTHHPSYPFLDLRPIRVLGMEEVESALIELMERLRSQEDLVVFLPLLSGESSPNPWYSAFVGGALGLIRSLKKERGSFPRIVHLSPSLSGYPQELPLDGEIAIEEGRVGRRTLLPALLEEEVHPTRGRFLLVGGGRGILSLVAERWEGAELWICGRRPEPDPHLADLSPEELRKLFQRRTDPAKSLEDLRAEQEIAQVLKNLRDRGVPLRYITCDATRREAVLSLYELCKREGVSFDGLIYGAGIEKNALFEKTSPEDLRHLLQVKLEGAYHFLTLSRKLRIPLFVATSSIAYTFGNAGQTAYACANGAMAGLVSAYPEPERRIVLHLTAWGGRGMATRGAIPEILRERGIEPLPPERGVSLFFRSLSSRERELVIREGVSERFLEPQIPEGAVALHPFSPSSDPALLDHSLSGEILLPGVYSLACLWERYGFIPFKVTFQRPIRYPGKDLWIAICGDEEGGVFYEETLEGVVRNLPAYRYERLRTPIPTVGSFPPEKIHSGPWDTKGIYPPLFHGERFQVLCGGVGIMGEGDGGFCRVEVPAFWEDRGLPFITAMKVEALLQLGGILTARDGSLYLPVEVEVSVEKVSPEREGVARLRRIGQGASTGEFLGEFVTSEGVELRVRFQLRAKGEGVGRLQEVPGGSHPFPGIVLIGRKDLRRNHDPRKRREEHHRGGIEILERALQTYSLGVTGAPSKISKPLSELKPGEPVEMNTPQGLILLQTSRSHTDPAVCAGVASKGGALGVDCEAIALRSSAFVEEVAVSEELREVPFLSPLRETLLFSIKEAVLKALGTGLKLPLSDLRVRSLRLLSPLEGEVQGDLLSQAKRVAEGRSLVPAFRARFYLDPEFVVVSAFIPEPPAEEGRG